MPVRTSAVVSSNRSSAPAMAHMLHNQAHAIELDDFSAPRRSTAQSDRSSDSLKLANEDDDGGGGGGGGGGGEHTRQLPSVDGGREAWLFVLSSWFLETFVWGLGFSAGTLQLYLSTHPPFNESSLSAISSIGTLSLALEYMLPLGVILVYKRYADWARTMLITSALVNVLSMLASSFATHVWQLILLQGVLCGISGAFLYTPVVIWMSEWFVEKRGLASGIIFSGTGVGGAAFPLVLSSLLDRVGFAWTIRIWSFITLVVYGGCALTLKPRLPVAKPARGERGRFLPLDWSWAWHPVVLVTCALSFAASLSFFPISLYLTTFVDSISSSTVSANVCLACFNITAVFSQVIVGWASDKMDTGVILGGLGLASGLTACLALGFADSLGKTLSFAILFGSFAGGVSTWAAIARDIGGSNADTSMFVFCQFSIFRGIASIVGPLISSTLYNQAKARERAAWASFGFRDIIVFVASMAFFSAALGGVLNWTRRKTLKKD